MTDRSMQHTTDAHITDARGVYLRTETLSIYAAQPAGAVYAELPEAEEGFTRVWAEGAWHQVADAKVPPISEPALHFPVLPQFTSLEMLDLFTGPEQRAVKAAAMSDVDVGLWYDRLLAASFVTWADPRTEAGLLSLVDAGLITAPRQQEIAQTMQGG